MPNLTIVDNHFVFEIQSRDDMDLRLIYTPLYFETVGLKTESNQHVMVGGYFQETEKLTVPFRYIVYLVEENPVSTAIRNLSLPEVPSMSGVIDRVSNLFTSSSSSSSTKSEPVKTESSVEDQEVSTSLSSLAKPELSVDFLQKSIIEPIETAVVDVAKEATKLNPVEDIIETPLEQVADIIETPNSLEIPITTVPMEFSNTPIIVNIEMEPEIENNGKILKDILEDCKSSERTIETIDETGMTYLLLEQIVFNIHSQLTFLNEHFNSIYSEFREDFIYNINGRYVILDHEKLVNLGKDESTKNPKLAENHKLFSDFIQKLKFGDSLIKTTNDNIIDHTNVAKIQGTYGSLYAS